MATQGNIPQCDVQLEEEVPRSDQLPAGEGFYENMGSWFWGEADGHNILNLEAFFRFAKGSNSPYRIFGGDQSTILYHTFALAPQDKDGGMVDNEFYGNWIDSSDAIPDFEVVKEPDRVILKGANRQYINRPPYWDIQGESMGVEFDVTLSALGPVHRPYEPWAKFAETHRGGFWVPCRAEGTVVVKGKKYTLENAYGMHEYTVDGANWDTFELIRDEPYNWIWGINDSVQFYTFTSGKPEYMVNYGNAYVWNDGQEVMFSPDQIILDELQIWDDPRSGMNWPVRWHLSLSSEKGLLDMNIAGQCRGIFCSPTLSGMEIHYGVFARGNGRFFKPDGGSVTIENMIVYMERARKLMAFDKA